MTSDTGSRTRTVGGRVSAAAQKVRGSASSARSRADTAYGTVRERASQAQRRTAESIEANIVGALVGSLAVGALIAAVLPATRRESQAFGKLGRRINDKALESLRAAREAGAEKFEEFGISRDSAKQKLNEIADNAGEAARVSAGAAAESLRRSRRMSP